jgi:hypothetical protein
MGELIESLLYYQHTTLHIGRNEIHELTKTFSPDELRSLLRQPNLSVEYKHSLPTIGTDKGVHFVDTVALSELDIEKEIYTESKRHTGDRTLSRLFARRIAPYIEPYTLPQTFSKQLIEQLKDETFRKQAAIQTMKFYQPGVKFDPDAVRFDVKYIDDYYFTIDTNIDFSKFTQIDAQSPVLSLIVAAEDLYVMADKAAEISLPDFNAQMMQVKVKDILDRTNASNKEKEVFNHYVFDNSGDFRRIINKGKVSMKEMLVLLDKAEKFKGWLDKLPDDGNLMREFTKALTEKSVFEHGHAKAIRFYVFNGIGILLTAAAPAVGIPVTIALNALDSFVLDKLGKKWNPNQFVNDTLSKMIK